MTSTDLMVIPRAMLLEYKTIILIKAILQMLLPTFEKHSLYSYHAQISFR